VARRFLQLSIEAKAQVLLVTTGIFNVIRTKMVSLASAKGAKRRCLDEFGSCKRQGPFTRHVSGFVVLRHNNREAVVPFEIRGASAWLLAFGNANGTFTGVALCGG
jgi:hypothetical protein